MRKILIGLLFFGSISSFAFIDLEDLNSNNTFYGIEAVMTGVLGTDGCLVAKLEAKSEAKSNCHWAGFKKCTKVSLKKIESWRSTIQELGYCQYEAVYKGINE